MKYIRTKEGIYKTVTDMWGHEQLIDKNGNVLRFAIDKQKQADTIEELCDEFIRIANYSKNSKPFFIKPFPSDWEEREKNAYQNDLFQLLNEERRMKIRGDDFNLYGAIWTDKGLIYVAKMNDKGELELL